MTKGRTLFDIISGKNKQSYTPIELQYYNPLAAKIGNTVSFTHDSELKDINFVVTKIGVFCTEILGNKFYHTDYHLKGISVASDSPIKYRLRLTPDEDSNNHLGCKLQLFQLFDEMGWDEDLYKKIFNQGEFQVDVDDFGHQLDDPKIYWRVEDVIDPYHASVTLLVDKNGDGKVEYDELENFRVTYWDYHRDAIDENEQQFREYMFLEMKDDTKYFVFLRGIELLASDIYLVI